MQFDRKKKGKKERKGKAGEMKQMRQNLDIIIESG